FSLFVQAINHAPAFQSTPLNSVNAFSSYAYHVVVTDPDGDAMSFSWDSALPAWLHFQDNGDGTGILTGTPDNADAGEYSLQLMVSDGDKLTSQSIDLSVGYVNRAPTFTSTPGTAATSESMYRY